MNLLDLPTELLQEIFTYAVWIRGVKLALRLTLVNKHFAREVEHVIIASGIFNAQGFPSHGRWKDAYCINKVFTDRLETPLLLHDPFYIIYRCAELICHELGQPGKTSLRAVIEALCGLVCNQYNIFLPRGSAPHFGCTLDQKSEDREKLDTHLLVAASYMNCVSLVKQVLSKGYDPTVSSWVFGRSLRAAAIQGNNEILELLLSGDIPGTLYEKKRWAINGATDGGHLDTLDLILEERWGVIPLSSQKPKSIMHSMKRGLHSPNVAIALRTMEMLSTTFPPKDSKEFLDECFCDAVNFGHLERALKYLEMGASIEGVPSTRQPLTRACRDGNYEIVKMILERGGDPNPDVTWKTPLQEAASRGYLGISRILLDYGADVNDVAPGWAHARPRPNLFPPPIVLAIQVEHVEMFRLFRQRGAVLDSPGIGVSTLQAAISAGLESMVVLLLREGVMVDNSVVGFAIQEGQSSIAHLLRLYKSGLAV